MPNVFDFSSFPILTTERLRLRQLTHDDADAILAIFGSEGVRRFLSEPVVDTREQAIELIDWFDGNYLNREAVQWAITLHGDDHLIGTCGTYAWDRSNRHPISAFRMPSHWRRGYATEATRAMIRWCFDNMDLHRIQADCTDGNIASERVLLKCGFKVEGLWRENCWEHGRFVDSKLFGLLRREYRFK
jgi:ribosomal-protein-alanine N-acetyltransferase